MHYPYTLGVAKVYLFGSHTDTGTPIAADFIDAADAFKGPGISHHHTSAALLTGIAAIPCLLGHDDELIGIDCGKLGCGTECHIVVLITVYTVIQLAIGINIVDGAARMSKPFLIEPEHTIGKVIRRLIVRVYTAYPHGIVGADISPGD